MVSGNPPRIGKGSKRPNAEAAVATSMPATSSSSVRPASAKVGLAEVAAAAAAAAAAAVAASEASDKKIKKIKKTKKIKKRKGEEQDCTRQVAVAGNEPEIARGCKRRKKDWQDPPHEPIAPAALGFACTSKVVEYAVSVTDGSMGTMDTAVASVQENMEKKKKKKKTKRDKREKNSSGRSPSLFRDENRAQPTVEKTNGKTCHPRNGLDAKSNDDADDSPALEGMVHEGVMYLVDARRRVFSALRDGRGNLVEVGTFDDERGKVTMVEKMAPPSTPAEGNMPRAPSDPDPAVLSVAEGSGSKKTQKKKKKKKKKKRNKIEKDAEGAEGAGPDVVDYPFEVEECDHCETSEQAYADVAPLLSALAGSLGKAPKDLMIYDPYYCQGSTVARLASLGFPRVHNRKEDFYKILEKGNIPEHDVVVTNPPFSGDHVPKILNFCARQGAKPWFLLLPNYVYLKDYYEPCLGRGSGQGTALPFYLTPAKRYMFYSPRGSRLNVKSSERKTSPFNTFWYIRLGNGATTSKILQSYDSVSRKADVATRCCVARTTQQIPYKMMDSNDPRRKKARDRQRSIDRIRKKKSEWVLG